jgi:hypothetical protein
MLLLDLILLSVVSSCEIAESRRVKGSFDVMLTLPPLDRIDRRLRGLAGVEISSPSSSSSRRRSLYWRSISGVILPWFVVCLCLTRNERRWRDIIRWATMLSEEMHASGDRSASGCGSVVLRPRSAGSVVGVNGTGRHRSDATHYHRTVPESPCLCSGPGSCSDFLG